MSLESLVAGARRWLQQKHIQAPDEWISACTEFVLDEQNLLSRGYALTAQQTSSLHNEILQQWLHADLKEIGTSSLPPRITLGENPDPSHRVKLDPGKYAVQLEWIIDVATPAYTQLLKITGAENENESVAAFPEPRHQASWEPKKKRMMKFEMNDGTRSIFGMEWKPIKKLHDKMRPGLKLLLIGPVNIVRGGTLFLSDENIQVIGGDVDSMGNNDGGGVDPLAARLGSRLNLRGAELKKRFPNLGKRNWNKIEPLDVVTNTTLPVIPAAVDIRNDSGGGGGGGGSARVKVEQRPPHVKVEPRINGLAISSGRSRNSTSSSDKRPVTVKSEPPVGSSSSVSSSNSEKTSQKLAAQNAERGSISSSSRPLKTSQKPATIKTETPFHAPSSPAPTKERSHTSSVSRTPPTPAHHKAVLNDLFGVSQSPSQPASAAKSSGEDLGDDDFDDDFDGDEDLFEKLEAIEQEAATDSQRPRQPEIETTLNYHPSTQQVVSTSVKLHNFSGELDISHDGGIKVSASPRPTSPGKLQAIAKSASRGMTFANAAVKATKSTAKASGPPSSESSSMDAHPSTSSSIPDRPWTPNQPPRAFQHDPLFSEEEGDLHLSQLKNISPLKAKRKSDVAASDTTVKRAKTESKK